MTKARIGVIGIGRFGKNYIRTFDMIDDAEISWICSETKGTLKKVQTKNTVKKTIDYKEVLKDREVDAVAIVTPATMHYEIAKAALLAGKHILVEKPATTKAEKCEELVRLAEKKKRIFMAAHIHRYNPGIQKLKKDIDAGKLGKINYIHYTHLGNGPIRKDVNALWDYFPHALTIIRFLTGKEPKSVSANGACYLNSRIHDVVSVDVRLTDNIYAATLGSWLYPFKRMDMVVAGEKKFAVFDDYAEKEKLKYYDKSPRTTEDPTARNEAYEAPEILNSKPLTNQLKHFIECITQGKRPLTGGMEALKIIKVLESAQKSLENKGAEMKIE